jgi:C-terminal processing protease CtpA/Prc
MQLPGGISVVFTGLGVYYPDGTPTQRIGIVPDIVIKPTLKGFRAGRDEVLERAIEYIRTGR